MTDTRTSGLSNQSPADHLELALLPWEDVATFRSFHQRFLDEHNPVGPTETGFVETISWAEWRRRRLRLAERSLHLERAYSATNREDFDLLTRRALVAVEAGRPKLSSKHAIETNQAFDEGMAESCAEDQAMTKAALERLQAGGSKAYEEALALLREDSRDWWQQVLEDEPSRFREDAEGLAEFINVEIMPWYVRQNAIARYRPDVRLQAWGESLPVRTMSQLHLLDERLQRTVARALQQLLALQKSRAKAATPFKALG